MEKRHLKILKSMLEERKIQIKRNIQDSLLELNALRDSGASDEFDFANINADALLEQSITTVQKKELNEIDTALDKMESGTYGICEMCEEDIDIARLKVKPHALPWA